MKVLFTVVDRANRQTTDVLMDAAPDTAVGEVTAALAQRLGLADGPTTPLFLNGTLLDPTQTFAESPLIEGALLSTDTRVNYASDPIGSIELRVVTGPGAGQVMRLGVGEVAIGSDPTCALVIAETGVAAVAVRATVDLRGTVRLHNLSAPPQSPGGEDQPTKAKKNNEDLPTPDSEAPRPLTAETPLLDGEPLGKDETLWPLGGELQVGSALIELHQPTHPDAALVPSAEGPWVDYNRPPRLRPPARPTKFGLPTAPSHAARSGVPLIGALAPTAMAAVMAIAMKQPTFLLMAAMTPMMLAGGAISTKRQGKKTYRQQLKEYRRLSALMDEEISNALVAERKARRLASPDPAQLMLTATGPRARLWERRRSDPDHLALRVGTADLPSDVTVNDPQRMEHKRQVQRIARDMPVTVTLSDVSVLGVAGPEEIRQHLANWLVGQLAVLQSPRDVQLYILCDSRTPQAWRWAVWLPHLRPNMGQDAICLIGTDTETVARRVAEVNQIIAERKKVASERSGGKVNFDAADIVVVLDGAMRLRALPGVVNLLKDGPSVGVYCICIDASERLLPEECGAVLDATDGSLTLRQQLADDIGPIRADLVPSGWYARVARALAPIRDVSDSEDDSAIPSSSRLLDVLGLEPPTGEAIAARWLVSGTSTRAVIGESLDGAFAIDLRKDGPHGLVAGTTGSGKSELLQTIVASLAVANRPDAMTFVLVDYKGGAAFKDCVNLPHTVGMVTDLDTHLVERALTSLGAELTRREHILSHAGAKDIEDYVDYATRDSALKPLPRLLIVIDEFASMARELPDFVTGLVNIAQRGRSLGIHLILATQRPTGVVSPEIRANTNLRIALRVTDPAESSDVIDAPDAARITKATPGRAYVRLGHASLVPFQSGRVGGRRPGERADDVERPKPFLSSVDWQMFGRPAPQLPKDDVAEEQEITDLAVLVAAVQEANSRAGVPPQHSPWLAALPEILDVSSLPGANDVPGPDTLPLAETTEATARLRTIPFGLADIPAEQRQSPAQLDLSSFGHLYIVGSPRSGRSQALRTIAAMAARTANCADIHLFGIDCGNGALLPLTKLPHCGAVVQRTQVERAQRLVGRLRNEVMRRQDLLGAGGFADITEQRAARTEAERLPHLLVLLDRWEGFTGSLGEVDGGVLNDQIMFILREGASAGVHMIIAGDRSLLSGRMTTLTEDKLLLRLADRSDYSLGGLTPRKLPDNPAPGRAFRSESGIETQFALLGADPSGPAQAAAIQRIAEWARQRDAEIPRNRRAFRVDVLPARLTFDEAWEMREDQTTRPLWALLGVGGDELLAAGVDFAKTSPSFVIGGPPKSGRSTLLMSMAQSILRGGGEIVVMAPRQSPLRDLDGVAGVRTIFTDASATAEQLAEVLSEGPVALLIDDAELTKESPAGDWLRDYLRTAGDNGKALAIAGNAADICSGFTGWQLDLKKARCGALLSPQSTNDADLIGARLPRSAVGNQIQPGRALVHLGDGELLTLQVPG